MGWLCVLGWQTMAASAAFLCGTQIQGLIVLNNPNYTYEAWHGTLLTIAVAAFAVLFNTALAKHLPAVEGLILVIHVFSWVGIIVSLWVLAPMVDAKTVFTTFSDNGGWGSLGGSSLVGITASLMPLLGADAAVHMSEEVHNASRSIPQSMLWTTFANGGMAWIMAITLCFAVAAMDLEEVLGSETGYPFSMSQILASHLVSSPLANPYLLIVSVFLNATGSVSGASAMISWIIVMAAFCNLSIVATASRQLFAFARDVAVPFSPWFSRVSSKWNVPLNSIICTFLTTSLLSLINLGSSAALNSITSLATNALLSSYICSIGCLIWRRTTGQPLLPSKFVLGRWGLAVNIASEVFLVVAFVLAFFPVENNPEAASMNWNILIYGVVVMFSLVYYVFRGRHRYAGPVEYVRKME